MIDIDAPHWSFLVVFLLILLVAAGLRLYRLPELPLGLHYDEAANGILAAEIAQGATPVFIPSYTGKEVLFFYWTALWMKLLGATPLALRLSAALVGLATVAATVWVVRELLHGQRNAKWIALLTAIFLAASFWHLILSRYGFRAVTQPLLQALTVAALWRGLRKAHRTENALCPEPKHKASAGSFPNPATSVSRRRWIPWLILAGLFCGLTAYTYLAARAFPVPLAAALLALLAADWSYGRSVAGRRAHLSQISLFVAVAALALAPLAHYWLTHPGSFMNRTQQVAAASWSAAWNGIRACLGMFFVRGDPYIRFNIPHRPLFDPLIALLFLLGLIAAVWKFVHLLRNKSRLPVSLFPCLLASYTFLLTCLPIMLLPSALAGGEVIPSNLRAVGLLPFVYLFPALGLWAILDLIRRILPSASRLLPFVSCLLLLVLSGIAAVSTYFGHWASSAELYYAADGEMVDIAAYLDRSNLTSTTPYVASIHYRHPTLAFLADDYDAIRWLTGGRTLLLPAEREGLLLFPRSASEDIAWVRSLLPQDTLVAAPPGPDGAPAFHVYRAGPGSDLTPTHPLTADLAHTILLLGYDIVGEQRSGEQVEIAVWQQVLNPPAEGDYGPVARLTDPWGFTWGETQPFHYPAEQWTSGEMIVDHLSIPVDPGAPPGDYVVCFGLYSPGADAQLPLLDNEGHYAGTWVELPLRLPRASKPPALRDLSIRDRLDIAAGDLTLLGLNLDTTTARPGERLYLTLFWRADESPLLDYNVALTLGDRTLYAGDPVHNTYPTSNWAAGAIVADRYNPRLPRDAPPGDYPLRLSLADAEINLGDVAVQAIERTFEAPTISRPITVTLGDQIELLGYNLSSDSVAPGDTLTLTLYWRALAEMKESYTVFAHLMTPDGSMTGQQDHPPVGGDYPTNLWLSGEVVADVYEIPIATDAAPGGHHLKVGMYVAETGARLPVAGAPDDGISLQSIIITE